MNLADLFFVPHLLSFTDGVSTGIILSMGGLGMCLGSILMSRWKVPCPVLYLMIGTLLQGLCFFILSLTTSFSMILIGSFLFFTFIPIMAICNTYFFLFFSRNCLILPHQISHIRANIR